MSRLVVLLCAGVLLLAGVPAPATGTSTGTGSPRDMLAVLILPSDVAAARQAIHASGGSITAELKLGNTLAADVPSAALTQLETAPGIARVTVDPVLRLQADSLDTWSQRLQSVYPRAVGATTLWSGRSVERGTGVGVAVLDSGIDADHPDFRDASGRSRVVRQVNAIFGQGMRAQGDDNGHGTFVAGIIGGRGIGTPASTDDANYIGIAPDVNLISLKVSNREGVAHMSSVVTAIEWVLSHRRDYNIRVLNLSLVSSSADSYANSVLDAAVELAWFQGVVVVVAAGNGGAHAPITAPANDPFVITVGATDDKGTAATADDRLASFSSFGPTRDGIAKPDLVAPGRHIVSTVSSIDAPLAQLFPNNLVGTEYIRLSGTSASAPVVSGVVAQLLQARPTLKPGQVKWLLRRTAQVIPGEGTGAGYPRVDAAVRYAGPVGSTDKGLEPNTILKQAFGKQLGSGAWNAVSWDTVSWDTVSWDTVSWDAVSWDTVSWDTVSWDAVVAD